MTPSSFSLAAAAVRAPAAPPTESPAVMRERARQYDMSAAIHEREAAPEFGLDPQVLATLATQCAELRETAAMWRARAAAAKEPEPR